jgi:uncharacterized protein (DUF1501 family)
MTSPLIHRRQLLKGGLILGCSAAAHPMMTSVTLAGSDGAAPLGDKRLVVIILRGAMDGLDLVRPVGDPNWSRLRSTLALGDALPLTGPFALHPEATDLHGLWTAGELSFVHATSTPYRDKRSHFQGQDMLEAGTGNDVDPAGVRDGWLNRMLQAVPGLTAETAFAIGREELKILTGAAQVRSWAPDMGIDISPQMARMMEVVYHDDPLFRDAGMAALSLDAMLDIEASMQMAEPTAATEMPQVRAKIRAQDALAGFAAARLAQETRIAVFSLNGWDTHGGQAGSFRDAMLVLSRVIMKLKTDLGPEIWGQTAVLTLTEFGRTVRENGSKGTDHGTGSALIAAGGAVRGGQILGQWPGLGEGALYQDRDLMPTSDVRDWTARVMMDFYGLDRGLMEASVFPGLAMQAPGGLLR